MTRFSVRLLAAAVAALCVLPATAFAAGAVCPSLGVPPAGSTILGGLEVDGTCVLTNVTIRGGVVVDASGHLELESSTVYNGIVVNGGELDLGFPTNSNGPATGNPNTIQGGIVANGVSDFDMWNATLSGGLEIHGSIGAFPSICSNTINGNVTISAASVPGYILFGDPEAEAGSTVCPGNQVSGSFSISNVTGLVEVEGNTIGGSGTFLSSYIEFDGNTIGGSATCTSTTIKQPSGPDPWGNTVKGLLNTCPS